MLDGDTYGFDGHECRVCPCKTRESSALLSPASLCRVQAGLSFPCLNFAKGARQHLLGSVRLPRVISVGPPRPLGRSSPLCAPAGKAAHTEALGQYSSASWDCHRQPPVGAQCSAPTAAVDDGPFALTTHPHRNRLHDAAAVGLPSPGSISTCRLERQLGQWLRWSVPAHPVLPAARIPCR